MNADASTSTVGSGWTEVRSWSKWATDFRGFRECGGEIGAELLVGRGKGTHPGKVTEGSG